MHPVTGLLSLLLASSIVAVDVLPDNWFGSYELDRSENFDEYLEAKGYGFFTRKIVALAGVTKVIKKNTATTFDFENLTTKKDLIYKNVQLGQEFVGEGLDSTNHKITFSLREGHLFERHIPTVADGEQKEDEYEFRLDGDTLVQILIHNGITCKRYFIRQ